MEMVKVFQSGVFIGKDRAMYHAKSDTPAQARTSNLNEVRAWRKDSTADVVNLTVHAMACMLSPCLAQSAQLVA